MIASIGAGYYQRNATVVNNLWLYLFHLHDCPDGFRNANPNAFVIWRGDSGNDGKQVDFTADPEAEATRFFHSCIEVQVTSHPGLYNACLGINERWPDKDDKAGLRWRARFELVLCRLVHKLGLLYFWGGISTGNLEVADLEIFIDLFREADAVNYHAYLKPNRLVVAEEIESHWIYRVTREWWPRLKQLGIKSLRLFLGECGPYYAEVREDKLTQLAIDVHRAVRGDCQKVGIQYIGACIYGAGMMADEAKWEQENSVPMLLKANEEDGATRVVITPNVETTPVVPGGSKVTNVEKYPAQFKEWQAAGGVENNFTAHLVGIGVILPTKATIQTLIGNARGSLTQIENAVKNLPLI